MRRALRAGASRGLIELRQSVTHGGDLFNHAFWPVLMLAALWFLRDRSFAGFALGPLVLPSILGMNAAMAMMSMSQHLTADREDGTLLRFRATPHGVAGYLTGKLISVSGALLLDLAIFVIPALFLIGDGGLATDQPGAWLALLGVLALGLVATLPAGAVLGSVVTTARGQSVLTLPVLAVIAVSGIFYPIAALPGWLQGAAQAFPIYWLGLGMRSALLPPAAMAVEIGGSWRHAEMVAVLGAWALAGLLVAPLVLRRMARRESGSRLVGRRDRALRQA
jgi:ABC-2 type transport system permease protein